MWRKTDVRKRMYMQIGVLVLAFLACNPINPLPNDPALSEAETQVAQVLTQSAVAIPTATRPAQPSPTATEIALPAISDSRFAEVQVAFTYDDSIFARAEKVVEPGHEPEGVDTSIFFPEHLFLDFTYADDSVDSDFYGIRVWPADEYAAMNPYAADALKELGDLLQTRPVLELNADFPVLPAPMAALWMSTQAEYLAFQNGSGVRYVVQRVQQAAPISNQSLVYRFLGLTDDGRFYVSARFIVAHPILPDDPEQYFDENATDWNTFISEDQRQYRKETAELLAAQFPDSFVPSLFLLDAMMESLTIE